MSDEKLRDLVIENNALLREHIRNTDEWHHQCAEKFRVCHIRIDKVDDRQWKTALALAGLVGAWEWAKHKIGM